MQGEFLADAKNRELQLEALAHVNVQRYIDNDEIEGDPFSAKAICDVGLVLRAAITV